jgi:hypothetical protein
MSIRPLAAAALLAACAGDPGASDGGGAPDAGAESGADAAPDARPDPCAGLTPACPAPGDLAEGGGLVPIDRCAFPLEPQGEWAARGAVLDDLDLVLDRVGLDGVLADLNRTAVPIAPGALPGSAPGVTRAFAWQSGDMSVAYWIPQGITGSGDGVAGGRLDGRQVLLVSWYYDQESDPGSTVQKGARIAVVDATDLTDVSYRLVLLVDPRAIDGRPDFGPVAIHAGGLAWVGRYLYVVHTGVGFRVFDLDRILRVSAAPGSGDAIGYDPATGDYHAHGYAYVLPQVETIAHASACAPRFSFVSLDRTSDTPSLVSGEYDATSIRGRLYRWPLDLATGRLGEVEGGRVIADRAWISGHSHLQGALARDGRVWLSSSKPAGAAGVLYRAAEGAASQSYGWSDTPEDLSLDPVDGVLWSLSEGLGARYVFAVDHAAVD